MRAQCDGSLAEAFSAYGGEGMGHLRVWVDRTALAGVGRLAPVLREPDQD